MEMQEKQRPDDSGSESRGRKADAPSRILPTTCMVMVEFPGIVINDAAALDTFGGSSGVAAALNTPGAMLPLRLRPDDPQSSAIFGDRVPTKNLIVRVVRRCGVSGGAPSVRAEVVARVPEALSFKGMADFQVCMRLIPTERVWLLPCQLLASRFSS